MVATTFGERLAAAMRRAGMDTQSTATALGVSYNAVRKVLAGTSKQLKADNSAKAARIMGVDAHWLATGEGQMAPVKVGEPTGQSCGPEPLRRSLEAVLDRVAQLTPGQWSMVRARMDSLPGSPEMRDDVADDVMPLLLPAPNSKQHGAAA